jgi:acylphosphatase
MSAARLIVHGRVQGVGFRDAVRSEAESAGATGWACNRSDGAVEVHVEGEDDAVERVASFAGRGPRGAEVERVERSDADPEGSSGFSVR